MRVFETAIVRKTLERSSRNHGRNTDMMKVLALVKDIVEMVRARRLSHFGHIARMGNQR